jgi:hypothetical protein
MNLVPLQAAHMQLSSDPTARNKQERQDDKGEQLKPTHCRNPPRIILAIKCSANAAKSQIAVPTTKSKTPR